jgi:cbb3-type cytochrome oxidase subunit 3
MLERLRFEFLKLRSFIILLLLLLIFLLSYFFVNSGIEEYKNIVKEQEIDVDIEVKQVENQPLYDQYGVIGHRIFILPSPLIIYFYNSSLLKDIESNISSSEVIKIYFNVKGDKILKKPTVGFRDFGGILNTFGSILMLILGVLAFKNREFPFKGEKRVFLHGFLRLLLLNCYFILLMLSMYILAVLNHIRFSRHDSQQYIIFIVATIFYLNMWFLKGMCLSFLLNYKRGLLIAVTIWALISICTPEIRYMVISRQEIKPEKKVNFLKMSKLWKREQNIMNKVLPLLKDRDKNIDKIRSIMKEGAEAYLENEGTENKLLEQELHNSVKVQIEKMENFSCYLPWPFYQQLQESISSKGYETYNGFVDFVIEMRDGFFRYIIDKRYNSKDKKVIPYIKQGENVFHSHSVLPRGFLRGILSTLIFSLLFIGLSILVYWRRQKKENNRESKPLNVIQFNQNKSFFYRCKNKEEIRKYAQYLSSHKDVVLIEKIDLRTYDPGTCLKYWTRYICALQGLNSGEVMKLLNRLQVKEKELKLGPGKIDDKLFKKVYLALKLCEKKDYYILIEFFQGESEDFENLCKGLFRELPYRFIYLSPESLKQAKPSGSGNLNILAIDWFDEDMIVR